jgi:hypothetical protein
MEKSKIKIAVLLIFFCRPDHFSQVFEQVKRTRPSKLYLYQDGPRQGREDDVIGINQCREICSNEEIDWECEVHRMYQEKNLGCDPSEFIAQKWMFETEEMGIILEDDDIPSLSFFPFCKELLEKYKDDTRINMICGMNNTDVSEHIASDYFFTKKGSIWGWASWKRVLDTWDPSYDWLNSEKSLDKIQKQMTKKDYKIFIKNATIHRRSGKAHYESINAAAMYLSDSLNIVPKYNMISNIGISPETTHSVNDIRLLPKKVQRLMYKKLYEIEFPLVHPADIVRDFHFERSMSFSSLDRLCMRIEHIFRVLLYRGFVGVNEVIRRKKKQQHDAR